MTFTKDKAKELRNAFECWQQDYDPVDDKEQYDMFGSGMDAMDALLASLEAEPVYQFWNVKTHEWVECDKATYDSFTHSQRRVLYTATPAPVSVPEPIKRNDADGWWMYKGRRIGGGCAEWYNRALDDCRTALLQGAEPVSQPYKLRDGWVAVPVEPTAEMISSGIAAHYERSQIQINDRPAPGPMECAYMAMLAAAPQQEAGNG